MSEQQTLDTGDWVLIESTGKRGMVNKLERDRVQILFVSGETQWFEIEDLFKLVQTISPARPRKS